MPNQPLTKLKENKKMKEYKKYLFDESEEVASEMRKELATDTGGGLLTTSVELTQEEMFNNREQCAVISGIHSTICNLLQIDNIEFCTGGGTFHFDVVLSSDGKQMAVNSSPNLSREKLIGLNPHQLSKIIVELFLDQGNWSKEVLYSTILSDGEGNWI
jgi:hypothetical protein